MIKKVREVQKNSNNQDIHVADIGDFILQPLSDFERLLPLSSCYYKPTNWCSIKQLHPKKVYSTGKNGGVIRDVGFSHFKKTIGNYVNTLA